MNPVMYLIVDSTLKMSRGKEDAQVAHAAVEAYRLSLGDDGSSTDLVDAWFVGGHYTKIILQVDNLYNAREYIEARGFDTELIIDEGRTEFDGRLTPTALGVAIVDKDDPHVKATFEAFKLRKEPSPPPGRTGGYVGLRGRTLALYEVIPYLHPADQRIAQQALSCISNPSVPSGPSADRTLFGYPLQARADICNPGEPHNWKDITDLIHNRDGYAAIDTDGFLDRVDAIKRRKGR